MKKEETSFSIEKETILKFFKKFKIESNGNYIYLLTINKKISVSK